ncbi:uncharacterized protein LOC125771968 [Anopheles funestus]|uniref:uncharacterized protein LOC125771968 n=1 Tax=Anopheles funestus TaxID=62324 RepID=UPI0020C6F3F9|nr:uncharacterized protein LOC125771968 [Anopheles funestus]XP_049299158.1 uncharacterized protein LOC125771968 [Anopheles funestus]XP_049299159.1 uncharacterized protein LOC125771968 [Anopheles funestus]XP_049299160.1 uncharacterized protein LOC125771968 [Anopheles funestus]XP_049299161.1 uncharacterized protein LOC125771968 [Anopheles funestus]XP_049299162.1 uncharacterized protein LOC125771968 [Anopheles funestus]
MITCSVFNRWFHLKCVKLIQKPLPEECWLCGKCQQIKYELNRQKGEIKAFAESEVNNKEGSLGKKQSFEEIVSQLIVSQQQQTKEFVKLMATNGGESTQIGILIKRQSLMQLPKSDGNPKQWPNFKKTFDDTFKEGQFSNLENLNRLKQVLQGTAYKSVQQLMMEAENVPEIIKRLNETFGRPDLVYLQLLNDLQKIRKESRNVVSEMTSALENLVKIVHLMERPTYLKDHRLVMDLTVKLSHHIQVKRAEHMAAASSSLDVQNLEELCRWVKPYAKTAEMMNTITVHNQNGHVNLHDQGTSQKQASMQRGKVAKQAKKITRSCLICSKPHKTVKCFALVKRIPSQREKIANKNQLCFGCLTSNKHTIKDCRFAKACGIAGCKDKHHKMLHVKQVVPIQPEQINNHHEVEETCETYYQILPVRLINENKSINTYAFLDPGSSLTMIDANVARQLNLTGPNTPLRLTWAQGIETVHETSQQVKLVIKGATKRGFRLKDVRTIRELKLPVKSLCYDEMSEKYQISYIAKLLKNEENFTFSQTG